MRLKVGDRTHWARPTSASAATDDVALLLFSGPPLHEMIQLLAPLKSSLEVLWLNGNKHGGSITPEIAAFTKLTQLGLDTMGLDGTLRSAWQYPI